jgi:hypothetical protein
MGCQWRGGGGLGVARGEDAAAFKAGRKAVRLLPCVPRYPSHGMGRDMAGVRREGTATCGVYAGVRLVGRRSAAALRPMGALHVAPGKRVGKVVPRHMNRQAEAGLGVRPRKAAARRHAAPMRARSGAPGYPP